MSNILTYPLIPIVAGGDMMVISDVSVKGNPTRSVSVDQLGAYIGAGGGGAAGVTSFNTLVGALNLVGGTNIDLATVGNTITINSGAGAGTVTSVAATFGGNAFALTGSPITGAGTLAIAPSGAATQYINGLGNLALLSTIPTNLTLAVTRTTGDATLTGNVLDIPNYGSGGGGTVTSLVVNRTSGDSTLIGGVLNVPNYANTTNFNVASDTGTTSAIVAGNTVTMTGGTGISTAVTSNAGGAQSTINLSNIAGVAGNYTSSNLTIDGQGRITAAASGSGGSGTVTSLVSPTTSTFITNTVINNSTTPALTSTLSATGLSGNVAISQTQFLRGDNTWAIPAGSSSVWSSGSGNTINYTSGNVGVGISTPSAPLHVLGKIYQTGLGNSTFVGFQAGDADDGTTRDNAAFGNQALKNTSTGERNVAVGMKALTLNVTGNDNTVVGFDALGSMGSLAAGSDNVAIGHMAGRYEKGIGGNPNTLSTQSVFIGSDTLANDSNKTNQIVIGYGALANGDNSTVIGNTNTTKAKIYGDITAQGGSVTGINFKYQLTPVASLPVVTNNGGRTAFINNGTTYVSRGIVAGGGSVGALVYCDGTNWRYV